MKTQLLNRLREIDEAINLKQSVKARILMEIYYDMENLYEVYRNNPYYEDPVERVLD